MNIGLQIIIVILFLISAFMLIKIYNMKKSMIEIEILLHKILQSDTNNLLTISSSDKDIRRLAWSLNTELKNLRNQKLQYENGNQELKKSITNISHDMRTPLTAITGYMDLIKESKDTSKCEEYLKIVELKTTDLIILTEQLFDFSKTIDIGTNIQKEYCCINEILEDAFANYYIIFKEKNIVPKIDICKEKIYKYINKNTIIRVLENILSNVMKYSNGDFKAILNNTGKIIFSNKATSLDATTVKKIFNRYYTVENAEKSTGIGLSIAKQLIELNGGDIIAKYNNGYLIIEIKL